MNKPQLFRGLTIGFAAIAICVAAYLLIKGERHMNYAALIPCGAALVCFYFSHKDDKLNVKEKTNGQK